LIGKGKTGGRGVAKPLLFKVFCAAALSASFLFPLDASAFFHDDLKKSLGEAAKVLEEEGRKAVDIIQKEAVKATQGPENPRPKSDDPVSRAGRTKQLRQSEFVPLPVAALGKSASTKLRQWGQVTVRRRWRRTNGAIGGNSISSYSPTTSPARLSSSLPRQAGQLSGRCATVSSGSSDRERKWPLCPGLAPPGLAFRRLSFLSFDGGFEEVREVFGGR